MTSIACKKCGQHINSRVEFCPKCGAPRPSSAWIKLGVLALIAIALASTAFAIAHNRRAATGIAANIAIDDKLSGDVQMRGLAIRFVMRALQAPATAKFAPTAVWQTTPIDMSTSRMHAWVDSENASGITLRAFFTIAIRLNNQSASLLYLQFDDDEKPMFGVKPLTAEEKKHQREEK
jgi:RNA polymerase subunit RPABC4/transcription elongation factor Spt4